MFTARSIGTKNCFTRGGRTSKRPRQNTSAVSQSRLFFNKIIVGEILMFSKNRLATSPETNLEPRVLLAGAVGTATGNANGTPEDNVFNGEELSGDGVFNVLGRRGNDSIEFLSTAPDDFVITGDDGEIVQRNGVTVPAVRLLNFGGSEVEVFNLSSVETIVTRGGFEIDVQDALDTISEEGLNDVNLIDLIPDEPPAEQPVTDSPALPPVRNANGNAEDNVFDGERLSVDGIFNVLGRRGNDSIEFRTTVPSDFVITGDDGEIVQRNGVTVPAVRLLSFATGEVEVFNLSSVETIVTRGGFEIDVQDALDTISEEGLNDINLTDLIP